MRPLSERLLIAELKATLNRWGDWIERHKYDNGLPKQAAFLNIPTGNASGHRILCAQMPNRVAALHRAILRLDDHPRAALELWYACQHDDQGRWMSGKEKCERLKIDYAGLRLAVYNARRKLMDLRPYWMV